MFLASFYAEAKTVTCDLKIQTTDNRLVLLVVTTNVLEESSLRYQINIEPDVKSITNLDTTVNYKSLLIGKENCQSRQPSSFVPVTVRYSTISRWSFIDVKCPTRNVVLKLETETLKKLKLKEVDKLMVQECKRG